MPELNSITSTGKLADSLGGASLTAFTKQWGQEIFDAGTSVSWEEPDLAIHVTEGLSRPRIQIVYDTAKDTVNISSVITRVLCHALVSRIPDQGLPDVLESVNDIFGFFVDKPATSGASATRTQKVPARMDPVQKMPEFEIAGE